MFHCNCGSVLHRFPQFHISGMWSSFLDCDLVCSHFFGIPYASFSTVGSCNIVKILKFTSLPLKASLWRHNLTRRRVEFSWVHLRPYRHPHRRNSTVAGDRQCNCPTSLSKSDKFCRDAMQARPVPSCGVRPSVTIWIPSKRVTIFKKFPPQTIHVFPYQTPWQYSEGTL